MIQKNFNRKNSRDITDIKDESLGTKIKILRIKANIDQKEFAKMVGITVSYLSQIETGKKIPSLQCICKIAKDGFNINPINLIQDDPFYKELAVMLQGAGLNVDRYVNKYGCIHRGL